MKIYVLQFIFFFFLNGVFAEVSFSGLVIQVPPFWVDPYVLAPSMGFVYPARQKIVEVQDHGCAGSDLEFW